jgi:hypothetical protein
MQIIAPRLVKGARMKQSRESPDGEIKQIPALVPEGIYRLRFLGWSTHILFQRAHKVALHFAVMDMGEHFGKRVLRWYNATVKAPIGQNGRFKVGWSSDLLREYATLVGMPSRADRIALTRYEPLLLLGKIETVDSTSRQEKLPLELQYSVVRKLVGVEAGQQQ